MKQGFFVSLIGSDERMRQADEILNDMKSKGLVGGDPFLRDFSRLPKNTIKIFLHAVGATGTGEDYLSISQKSFEAGDVAAFAADLLSAWYIGQLSIAEAKISDAGVRVWSSRSGQAIDGFTIRKLLENLITDPVIVEKNSWRSFKHVSLESIVAAAELGARMALQSA